MSHQQHGPSDELLHCKSLTLFSDPAAPEPEPEPEVKQREPGEHKAISEEDHARDMDAVLSRVEAKLAAMKMKRGEQRGRSGGDSCGDESKISPMGAQ